MPHEEKGDCMKKKVTPEDVEKRAREYFREGLNCAECVFLAFLDTQESGLPREVVSLASGFGGGIGQTRHMCGAISGAVMALGTQKGRENPFAKETKKERAKELREDVYPAFADLICDIEEHFGTLLCSELTATYDDFQSEARRRNCMETVATCARMLAIHAQKDEGEA